MVASKKSQRKSSKKGSKKFASKKDNRLTFTYTLLGGAPTPMVPKKSAKKNSKKRSKKTSKSGFELMRF